MIGLLTTAFMRGYAQMKKLININS